MRFTSRLGGDRTFARSLMSRRLTALAIARALLATPVDRFGMLERLPHCVHFTQGWNEALVDSLLEAGLASDWSVQRVADAVSRSAILSGALEAAKQRPVVHGWFMTRATTLAAPPKALKSIDRPHWPSIGALAEGLNVSLPGLWRLTRSASWQRHAALGEQHYRYELLPKRTGGRRLLEVPHPYLRALQRKVLDTLVSRVPAHEAACAYVRGRSVVDHAQAHAGQAVLLKFDLQDFFATVRASRVHATFVELGYSATVARELMALCTTATPEPVLERLREQGGLTWTQAMRLRDAHLPQGAPTSAALAKPVRVPPRHPHRRPRALARRALHALCGRHRVVGRREPAARSRPRGGAPRRVRARGRLRAEPPQDAPRDARAAPGGLQRRRQRPAQPAAR